MSKYTEALSSIYFTMHSRVKPKSLGHCEDKNLEVLEELVERATPKKLKGWTVGRFLNRGIEFNCPTCDTVHHNKFNFCPCCGQAIDWSTDK